MKERQLGNGLFFVTLIQQLYFKTIRINVIIDFHFVDKATRKNKKNLNNLGTNPRGGPRPKEGVTEI